MGISSNQARFLSLTSRQVDLERRIQQICERRLRLTTELEDVVTAYNKAVSNRRLYTFDTYNGGINELTIKGINSLALTSGTNYQCLIEHGTTAGTYVSLADETLINSLASSANSATKYTAGASIGISLDMLGLPVGSSNGEILDAAIRTGLIAIGTQADEFTQTAVTVDGAAESHELRNWRSLPSFADVEYEGDDFEMESKYDLTVEEINTQDKKLQIEQTSIEVEYKAITSERESVKKILDQNASNSFKYFS